MQWFAQAPSNIALIKYMGKADHEKNTPLNASLSYTLPGLTSSVSLELLTGGKDCWDALDTPGYKPFTLSIAAQERFLRHLARIKSYYNCHSTFLVRSCNNFPQASGLASSASSFAALTKCAVIAISELSQKPMLSIDEQALLSREGSGSSCRSFYAPWALWSAEAVKAIKLPYEDLIHQAIIISDSEKAVSSSEAHQRIQTSPHYKARPAEANQHLKLLLNAFEARDWKSAYRICWQEFHNMHALFSSCKQPFTYITPKSRAMLTTLETHWQQTNDGPIITMDAGPNIHLLYRPDQAHMAQQFKHEHLVGNYDVI